MSREALDKRIVEADIEIKKQQANYIKAQTRRENAEAALIESNCAKMKK